MKLELRGITKRFGSLVANDRISLTVSPGEIHCLLGENGAGKSTLMNVLYGLYHADEGEILIDGRPVSFRGPGDAMAAGIGMVHQHFMLIPVFTVAENVMLGHEATGALGSLKVQEARESVTRIAERFGFRLDPDARIEDLPVGVQQRVEIVKALSREAGVLVFDEPTAVLTPQETDELMGIMRELKEQGAAIIFITHKLREVREVADRITVIRQGRVVGEASPTSTNEELASMMVGREVELTVQKSPAKPGEERLVVSGLTLRDDTERTVVDDVSFTVHAGEILAVAGVQGNGQTELANALLGLHPVAAGSISLSGEPLAGKHVRHIIDEGVGFIPEDRNHDGLVGPLSIAENLILNRTHGKPFVKAATIDRKELRRFAAETVAEFDIRTQGIDNAADNLSGGNQQKVVVARELTRELRLLVAAQPTRGVDVGSVEFIHQQIVAARDAGVAVFLVSTELDEVLALADRIMVMYRGRVVGIVSPDTPRDRLGLMMAGAQ